MRVCDAPCPRSRRQGTACCADRTVPAVGRKRARARFRRRSHGHPAALRGATPVLPSGRVPLPARAAFFGPPVTVRFGTRMLPELILSIDVAGGWDEPTHTRRLVGRP